MEKRRNDEYVYQLVSGNVKKYRREQGLTQSGLAEKTNFSLSFIKNIEGKNSAKQMSLASVWKIAEALNTDIYKFFMEDK